LKCQSLVWKKKIIAFSFFEVTRKILNLIYILGAMYCKKEKIKFQNCKPVWSGIGQKNAFRKDFTTPIKTSDEKHARHVSEIDKGWRSR